ncbi:hypothetical protein [uncultured Nocardioides sp.]|uniref:hypothetical protein n=1 Tax=uncultured Nocardioides sp. TaxID=198441 RepID=UPI00260B9971|nr:hypothetical protein [uncultured Nocardioides sp.]
MSAPADETDDVMDASPHQTQPVPQPEPQSEPLLPDAAPAARSRPGARRTALVVVPLFAGLVAAGAVGGQMLWAEIEGSEAAAPRFFCWNAEEAADPSDCPKPRGADGLAWVLPSFRPDRLDCVDELELNPDYNRPVMWTCDQVVGGQPVSVTYSQVTGQRAALRYFDKMHGDSRVATRSADGRSEVFRWAPSQTPAGDWQVSLLLRDAPYAVTVVAPTAKDAERTLEHRVRIRPPGARRAVELT